MKKMEGTFNVPSISYIVYMYYSDSNQGESKASADSDYLSLFGYCEFFFIFNGRHLSILPFLIEITACSKFQSIFSLFGPFEELLVYFQSQSVQLVQLNCQTSGFDVQLGVVQVIMGIIATKCNLIITLFVVTQSI